MFLLYACVYIVQLIVQLMIMQALRAIIKKTERSLRFSWKLCGLSFVSLQ